jgi:hypothetical protein
MFQKISQFGWNQIGPARLATSGPAKPALTAVGVVVRCHPSLCCVPMIAPSYSAAAGLCCRALLPRQAEALFFRFLPFFIPE